MEIPLKPSLSERARRQSELNKVNPPSLLFFLLISNTHFIAVAPMAFKRHITADQFALNDDCITDLLFDKVGVSLASSGM